MLYTFGCIGPVPFLLLGIGCLDGTAAQVSFEEPPAGLVRAREDGELGAAGAARAVGGGERGEPVGDPWFRAIA